MWVTAWSLESQPFNSWESTTDLQDLQDFLFLFLRLFVCIRKSFQVDTRDAILSLNEAPVLFVSWGFEGDVIQRVNRIFTADDNVLAGGALKKVKKSFVAPKKTPVFFWFSKSLGLSKGGRIFRKAGMPKKLPFFSVFQWIQHICWAEIFTWNVRIINPKKEKTALDFWNLWDSWIWT